MSRMLIVVENTVPFERIQDCRELATSFATFLEEPVEFVFARPESLLAARMGAEPSPSDPPIEVLAPAPPQAATMSSADFVYQPDGRPDWRSMWEGFCELALYGGPPHRGSDAVLEAPASDAPATEGFDAVDEIRRGIWMTSGLYSEADEANPGWLTITCRSRAMAAWMCATIILENVEAKFDEERLLVPASPSFTLKDEVKSVITVVAKTHHYWTAHAIQQAAATK